MLSNPVSATLGGPSTAVVTIIDNDPQPTVQLSAGAYSVGEAAGSVMVTATLSGPSAFVTTVAISSTDATASRLTDYTAISQTISIPAGTTQVGVPIAVTNDGL